MDVLNLHIKLLAENGKPFASIMGVKRGLYRLKGRLCVESPLPSAPPQGEGSPAPHITVNEHLMLLIGEVLDKLGVDILELVEMGFIGEKEIKRVLIVTEYERMARNGIKYKDIKRILGKQYGWSVSSIEKLVYKKG
jgi:hypothetical protein